MKWAVLGPVNSRPRRVASLRFGAEGAVRLNRAMLQAMGMDPTPGGHVLLTVLWGTRGRKLGFRVEAEEGPGVRRLRVLPEGAVTVRIAAALRAIGFEVVGSPALTDFKEVEGCYVFGPIEVCEVEPPTDA